MKKLLSTLFSLFIFGSIGALIYFNKPYCMHQINKVKAVYYIEKGDMAYSKSEMHNAIRLYSKGLSLYPKHYEAWYNLGNIYVSYEDYQSALYAYSQAFKYNPKMMIARINYGIVASEKLGDFDGAIDQYNKVIGTKRRLITIPYIFDNKVSSKENKAIAYYNRGVTYKMKALYTNANKYQRRIYLEKAIESYKKSVEINKNSYDAQFNLGLAYHAYGDYSRAGKCYCKAINLEPLNYESHYNLAILLRRLKHYEEAYEEIDKAIILISALDGNSNLQQYVATVMNDITKSMYLRSENRQFLKDILNEEKNKIAKHSIKDSKKKEAKDKKKGKELKDSISSSGISIVNGQEVATEDLDQAILEEYGNCPAIKYFDPTQKSFEYSE